MPGTRWYHTRNTLVPGWYHTAVVAGAERRLQSVLASLFLTLRRDGAGAGSVLGEDAAGRWPQPTAGCPMLHGALLSAQRDGRGSRRVGIQLAPGPLHHSGFVSFSFPLTPHLLNNYYLYFFYLDFQIFLLVFLLSSSPIPPRGSGSERGAVVQAWAPAAAWG